MTSFSKALAVVFPLSTVIAVPALAQAPEEQATMMPSAPKWSVKGSVPLQWTNNVFSTPTDHVSDTYVQIAPFTVLGTGSIMQDLEYTVKASLVDLEKYFRKNSSNTTVAGAGFDIARHFAGSSTISFNFESDTVFEGIFHSRQFTANNVGFTFGKEFDYTKELGWTFAPNLVTKYVFADVAEQERLVTDVTINIVRKINEVWGIFANPEARISGYTHGGSSGRRDLNLLLPFGVQYTVSEHLNVTFTAQYATQISNRTGNDFQRWDIGPALNFAF